MPLTQSTPRAAPTTERARRLRRVVAATLLATSVGAGTVALAHAGSDGAANARDGRRQLRVTLHVEDRRELSLCAAEGCPAGASVLPRREKVHRVRTFTLSWATPAAAPAPAATEGGAMPARVR